MFRFVIKMSFIFWLGSLAWKEINNRFNVKDKAQKAYAYVENVQAIDNITTRIT